MAWAQQSGRWGAGAAVQTRYSPDAGACATETAQAVTHHGVQARASVRLLCFGSCDAERVAPGLAASPVASWCRKAPGVCPEVPKHLQMHVQLAILALEPQDLHHVPVVHRRPGVGRGETLAL